MWKKHSVSALLLAGGLLAGCAEEPAQQEETGQDEKTGIEIGMTFDSFIIPQVDELHKNSPSKSAVHRANGQHTV